MAKDATLVPAFGAFIKERRGERSLEAVSTQMRAVGIERVNSALYRYEAGRLPPVDVLRGLSFALRVPFEELVDRLLKELGVVPVKWGQPVVHLESELPDDALAIAKAYASCEDERLRAATRTLLLGAHEQKAPEPSAAVDEKKTGTPVPRVHRSHRRAR
jgi:hypothetical protein